MKKFDTVFIINVMLVAVTMPLPFVALNNGFIISLVIMSIIRVFVNSQKQVVFGSLIILALPAFLFFLYLIGVLYSQDKHTALSSIEHKLPLLFFPFIFYVAPKFDSVQLKAILSFFLYACAFIAITCACTTVLLNWKNGIAFTLSNHWYFSEENLVRRVGFHHTYFSVYLCFCLVIISYLVNADKSFFFKSIHIVIFIFLTLFIMALSSRIGLITVVFIEAIIIFLAIPGKKIIKASAVIGLVLFLGAVAYQFPFVREKFSGLLNVNKNEFTTKYNSSVRGDVWKSCIQIIEENWLLGTGTGDLQAELDKKYEQIGHTEALNEHYNSHSQYLDTFGSIGIIGFTVLLIMLSVPAYLSWQRTNIVFFLFLLIIVFFFFTETMLARQKGVVFFSFFFCLMISCNKEIFNSNAQLR